MLVPKWVLLAFWTALQGMAPLLHAHLGGDQAAGRGVHMHAVSLGPVTSASVSLPRMSGIDAAVIVLGQELRGDPRLACADGAPPSSARPRAAQNGSSARAVGVTVQGPGVRRSLLSPPAQGPPTVA